VLYAGEQDVHHDHKIDLLGVPAGLNRACQQALLNRLEPIFEPIFDEARNDNRPRYPQSEATWSIVISGGGSGLLPALESSYLRQRLVAMTHFSNTHSRNASNIAGPNHTD
jgi:hypothetical protein